MESFYGAQTNKEIEAKIVELAGRFYLYRRLSGAAIHNLRAILKEVGLRTGNECSGRYLARRMHRQVADLLDANYKS